jgi:hypothetical protein
MNYSCISIDAADSDTGSSGMLGRNAGEARNSDLMRKAGKRCCQKGRKQCSRFFFFLPGPS